MPPSHRLIFWPRGAQIRPVASQDSLKQRVAEASLEYVRPGMRLGLGSGSTAELMAHALGKRMQQGLQIEAVVPTSTRTEQIAQSYGMPICTLDDVEGLDLTIDGADEVDPELNLIKGGGGQHLHEKIVAEASATLVIIVDASKCVDQLGAFAVPVEVIPSAVRTVGRQILELGGSFSLRGGLEAPYVTLEQNRILDCDFGLIEEPAALARALSEISGIVEHGLFIDLADVVLVGRDDAVEKIERP